jgi:tetratricopeptide (TPR) repeat protein/predicted Ser/Thr protein kinase
MTPERYEKIRSLFLAVQAQSGPERLRFLDDNCGDDEDIRAEVESLLASAQKADTFLRSPALGTGFALGRPESLSPKQILAPKAITYAADSDARSAGRPTGSPFTHPHPDVIGQYKILDVLGEGGMGVVYRAEQERPRRRVALKVIKPGVESRETLRRFEHEGQVLGRLQHPGIAQVFETGTADTGRGAQPFFAMELVDGVPLTDHAQNRLLGIPARLELVAKVCDAVHHAHQKGVVHRDLKPGNILVDKMDQPKILDFGVARATDADVRTVTLQTAVGQLVGTIAYMSPEQIEGDPSDLDTRSDVFSLGVICYELLTGHLPFDLSEKTIPQAARAIIEQEPASLCSISRVFRGDIDTIVAKALEKNRDRRYQSASDFADDIRRYLSDQPIAARPVTTMYQLRKFARRNKGLVAGVIGTFLALAAGTIVSTCLAVWAIDAEALAQQRLKDAQQARKLAEERRAEALTETTRATSISDFLVRMLGHVSPEVAMGRDVSLLRTVLDDAAADIQTDLMEYPEVQASIHHIIGTVYRNISSYDAAAKHLTAAHRLRTEHLGEDHADTLASLGGLAQVLWNQGRLDEAEEMYAALIADYRRTLGDAHRETLVARYDHAGVVKESGRVGEAEEELRGVLSAMESHLAEHDNALLDAMNGLAVIALERDQLDEAEQLLRTLVGRWTDARGLKHPKRLRALRNLTLVIEGRGDLPEAARLNRELLAQHHDVFGEDHHDTIQIKINFSSVLRQLGQLDEAETIGGEALEQATRVLGPEHPDTFKATSHLGITLRIAGKLDAARPHLERAVELSQKLYGPENPTTLNSLSSLAGLLYEQRNLEEAEKMMRRVVDGLRAAQGERSFSAMSATNNLGALLTELDKLDEAEKMLQRLIELVDQVAPPGHWFRWTARGTYGDCLLAMERFDDAERVLLEAFTKLNDSLGHTHHRTRGIAKKLARLYEAWGRPEDSAKYAEPPASQPSATRPANR